VEKKSVRRKSRKLTIDDILTRDDVNKVLDNLEKNKQDIAYIMAVYVDRKEGKYHLRATKMPVAGMVFLL
jgi:CRISPR/Cas system CSM-associated protein Csm3 (group 7 of RAMP superfamily)